MQEKTKLILTVSLAVLASAALVTAMVMGKSKIDEVNEQTAGLDRSIATEDGKLQEVPGLRRQVEHLSDVVVRYERILPNERELVNIVNYFNDARLGAGIGSVSSKPVTRRSTADRNAPVQPYEKHAFDIDFVCRFDEFVRFVNLLETQSRFMQIEKFSVNTSRDAGVLEASVTVSTYRFNPESAPAPATRQGRRPPRS